MKNKKPKPKLRKFEFEVIPKDFVKIFTDNSLLRIFLTCVSKNLKYYKIISFEYRQTAHYYKDIVLVAEKLQNKKSYCESKATKEEIEIFEKYKNK